MIRNYGSSAPPLVFAAGEGINVEGRVEVTDDAVGQETEAFLASVARHRPAPVSALDALHSMRIVERIQERLR